jgi:hypothetical protein
VAGRLAEPRGGRAWIPDEAQHLLLQACLLEDPAAAQAALGRWRALGRSPADDPGSWRLLPLLYRRWQGNGLPDPHLRALAKHAYLQSWTQGCRRLVLANTLSERLNAAGIPVLAIKGLPLALQAYGDPGARPMGDLDLAVPHPQARQAVEQLAAWGWQPMPTALKGSPEASSTGSRPHWSRLPRPLEDFTEAYMQVRHSHGFRLLDGTELDLHWFLFQGHCDPGIDAEAWQASLPLSTLNRVPQARPDPDLRALAAADHLLLLLAHGSRWNPVPPIRWVADAVLLLRHAPGFDWVRFLAECRRRQLDLTAHALLQHLVAGFQVPVPVGVLEQLGAAQPTASARRRFERTAAPPSWRTGLAELADLGDRHRQLHRRQALPPALGSFPRFLAHVLGAPGPGAVFHYAGGELQRRR